MFVCKVNALALFHCLLTEKYVLCPWVYFLLQSIIQFLHNSEDLMEGQIIAMQMTVRGKPHHCAMSTQLGLQK